MAEYQNAWGRIMVREAEPSILDRFFYIPCMLMDRNGIMTACGTVEELREFNQTRTSLWRSLTAGMHMRQTAVETRPQPGEMVLVRCTWKIFYPDRTIYTGWRQNYTLRATADGPKIMLSAVHTVADNHAMFAGADPTPLNFDKFSEPEPNRIAVGSRLLGKG